MSWRSTGLNRKCRTKTENTKSILERNYRVKKWDSSFSKSNFYIFIFYIMQWFNVLICRIFLIYQMCKWSAYFHNFVRHIVKRQQCVCQYVEHTQCVFRCVCLSVLMIKANHSPLIVSVASSLTSDLTGSWDAGRPLTSQFRPETQYTHKQSKTELYKHDQMWHDGLWFLSMSAVLNHPSTDISSTNIWAFLNQSKKKKLSRESY